MEISMLLEKPSNLEDKVISLKLVSGEEILAKCVKNDFDKRTKTISIKQPLILVVDSPRQKTNGQTHVSFEPWILSLSPAEVISLKTDHIVYLAEAGENAVIQYCKATEKRTNAI
jgi:hypothetical protein